jgi:hypothetical protein
MRVGSGATPAGGRRTLPRTRVPPGLRAVATTGRLPGASCRRPARFAHGSAGCGHPQGAGPAGAKVKPDYPPQSVARRLRKTSAMVRREAPRLSRKGARHERTMAAQLGVPFPHIWGTRKNDYRAMTCAHDCVRAATLLEHLSIVPDRTRNRRDSAIPFNDIEDRPRRCRLERRRRATRQR